jgi:hypothetical protein
MITTDISGNIRQNVNVSAGVDPQANLLRLYIYGSIDHRGVWRNAQLVNRQPEEKVLDDRIAHDHALNDFFRGVTGFFAQHLYHLVQAIHQNALQLFAPIL